MTDPRIDRAEWYEREAARLRASALTDLPPSPTSTSPSPTPSTTPTPSSDEAWMTLLQTMMTEMRQMAEASARETRELVITLVQGREQPNLPTEMRMTPSVPLPNYDDDSIPLSAGIQGVLNREQEEESELSRLQRERADLQRRIADIGNEMAIRSDLEASSAGPWVDPSGSDPPEGEMTS